MGELQMIYDKWWKSPGLTCTDELKNKDGKANPLGLGNIGGVFVVLLLGLVIALAAAFLEFMMNRSKQERFVLTQMEDHHHQKHRDLPDDSNMINNSDSSQTHIY